jgi:hypothetical protein
MADSITNNNSKRVKFNWGSVSSLSELKRHMVHYLNGKYTTSPWHFAPVDEETIPLLGNLIQLNQMGFITSQGQPTEYIYPVRNYKTNEIVKENGGALAEIKHGYIDGILDARKYSIPKLIENIQKDPSVCALLYKATEKRNTVYNLPDNPCIIRRNTISSNSIYGVTRYLNDTTGDVEYYTQIRYNDVKGGAKIITDNIQNKGLRNEIINNCYFISFIDNREPTHFNPRPEITLEQKVIDILNDDVAENAILSGVLAKPMSSMRRTQRRLSRRNRNKSYRR